MKINPVGSNQTEVETDKLVILFSYKTAVAFYSKANPAYYKTDKFWSKTTSKHINSWLKDINPKEIVTVSQAFIDGQCEGSIL